MNGRRQRSSFETKESTGGKLNKWEVGSETENRLKVEGHTANGRDAAELVAVRWHATQEWPQLRPQTGQVTHSSKPKKVGGALSERSAEVNNWLVPLLIN